MRPRTQLIVAVAALLAAAGVGFYVYTTFARMVTTARVVTPAMPIPAGALIEPGMLTEREAPRPLLEENIYVRAADLAGRVAVVPLHPEMVVYRPFAVTPAEYRLVDDPALEVVSFPVDPARAVGGQLQPGHRVDVWRLIGVRPASGVTLTEVAAGQWATATLLVEKAIVVDVRAATGQAVARSPQAQPGQVTEGQSAQSRALSSGGALQILTVAVPRDVAQGILALVAEEVAGAELWVSLAPLTESPATATDVPPTAAPPARPLPTAAPTLVPTAPPTPTPTPLPTALIGGTRGRALQVRDAPAGTIIGSLAEGTVVTILEGPERAEGADWYRVRSEVIQGWVSGEYLTPEAGE